MDREAVFDCYKRTVAKHEDIKFRGVKISYTSINRNVFSIVGDQAQISLRFSEDRKTELNKFYGSSDVLQYGAVMRGYISLPGEIVVDEATLDKLFSDSLEFAKGSEIQAYQEKLEVIAHEWHSLDTFMPRWN